MGNRRDDRAGAEKLAAPETLAGGIMERWREVSGFEGRLEVSDLGRVRDSSTLRIITPRVNPKGYLSVGRKGDAGKFHTLRINRLVLAAFDRPPVKGEVSRHLDGDPKNNSILNLRWGTQQENEADKKAHGTFQAGEQHYRSQLTEAQAREIKTTPRFYGISRFFATKFSVSVDVVKAVLRGRNWKHVT